MHELGKWLSAPSMSTSKVTASPGQGHKVEV